MADIQNQLGQRVGIIDPLRADRAHNTWHEVPFDPPFPEGTSVFVIPMTQTYNGGETPGLRVKNVTPAGFEIRFDEVHILNPSDNGSDGDHVNERVGWAAYAF